MHISRKGGETAIGFYHAIQAIITAKSVSYLKKIISISKKDKLLHGKYDIKQEDSISLEKNLELLEILFEKMNAYKNMPEFGGKIDEIKEHRCDFENLDLKTQALTIADFVKILSCGPETANLAAFVPKAGTVGRGKFNDAINRYNSCVLINQSPTGLYEEVINLKTVQPKFSKVK